MNEPNDGWSDWIEWPLNRDPMAVPPMVRPGDWVQTTLVLRPEWVGNPKLPKHRPHIYETIWDVVDGESFMISPPQPIKATHMVFGRFRIWLGEGLPPEIAAERAVEEMDCYDLLMGVDIGVDTDLDTEAPA